MTREEQDFIDALTQKYYNVFKATTSTIWHKFWPENIEMVVENLTLYEALDIRRDLYRSRRNLDECYCLIHNKTGNIEIIYDQ